MTSALITTSHDIPRQLAELIPMVTDSVPAARTQRAYQGVLERFFTWYIDMAGAQLFSKALVQRYVHALLEDDKAPSTVNQVITVLRRLAEEAHDADMLDVRTLHSIQKVRPVKRLGRHTGNWLSHDAAAALIGAPDRSTLKGLRDRVMLGLLMECGMRREEACEIDVQQFQIRSNRHILADVHGKGGRIRTVPVPAKCARRIEEWIEAADIKRGRLLRSVTKGGVVGQALTPPGVYKAVKDYAASMRLNIAPHDLRRTFAQLAHGKEVRLDQIKEALGHESIRTTEIYLGLKLDLQNAACDVLKLERDDEE